MKLKEFIQKNNSELAKTRQGVRENNAPGNPSGFDFLSLSQELLEEVKACEEFKNVKKFNILKYPDYKLDDNGEVIDEMPKVERTPVLVDGLENTQEIRISTKNPENYFHTQIYKLTPDLQFAETVDLYVVMISPIMTPDPKQVKEGVWLYPRLWYGDKPRQELRIVWNPDIDRDFDQDLAQAKELLVYGKSNLENSRQISIRCSDRSILYPTQRSTEDCMV